MSTKPQQFVAVAALLALGATSCSSAPEPRGQDARVPATQNTSSQDQSGDPAAGFNPAAPAGESRSVDAVGAAVIHERPALRGLPVVPEGNLAAIASLQSAAESARSKFRYQRAVELFRQLRDHEDTPKDLRASFHASMNESADIAYGLYEVRRELDRREFARAARRVERLSKEFPEVPFAMLVSTPQPQGTPVVPGVIKTP